MIFVFILSFRLFQQCEIDIESYLAENIAHKTHKEIAASLRAQGVTISDNTVKKSVLKLGCQEG